MKRPSGSLIKRSINLRKKGDTIHDNRTRDKDNEKRKETRKLEGGEKRNMRRENRRETRRGQNRDERLRKKRKTRHEIRKERGGRREKETSDEIEEEKRETGRLKETRDTRR